MGLTKTKRFSTELLFIFVMFPIETLIEGSKPVVPEILVFENQDELKSIDVLEFSGYQEPDSKKKNGSWLEFISTSVRQRLRP